VLHPLPKLQITVDAYQIKIKNRIVPSGDIFGYDSAYKSNGGVVSQAVLNALTSRGVSLADATSYSGIDIYTNGVSTRTRGIEATANYASDFGEYGKVDWSVGFNYNQTDITKINGLPASVYNADYGQTDLLTQNSKDALTTATPRVKVIANALWNIGKFSVNLRETIYGSTGQHISTSGSGNCATGNTATCMLLKTPTTFITDLNVGYKPTRSLRTWVRTTCSTTAPRRCRPSPARPTVR
jgi:iron complex outermembrane receptor protein